MTLDHLEVAHAQVLRKMCDSIGLSHDDATNEDVFVGFFQSFRPDGRGLTGLFDVLPGGGDLHERLDDLFEVAGEDRRPQGGRDAYFVVRKPEEISPQLVETSGKRWIARLGELAIALGHDEAAAALANVETIRVLEGIPPKHPKQEYDKTNLLRLLKDQIPAWLENAGAGKNAVPNTLASEVRATETTALANTTNPAEDVSSTKRVSIADSLRPAYYFITCDPMLRDYLMWPLYREHIGISEPMEPYFQLWKHGVKWRVYQEKQVDLYMPRRTHVEPTG